MTREDLIKYKETLSKLTQTERKNRDLSYIRKLATGEIQGPPTGYASIDKPWLKYYPEPMYTERKPYNKIIDYIKDTWNGFDNDIMIHYYGLDITAKEFFENVEKTAKSLKSLGLNNGDTIITNLEGIPEFIYLFFASELIGVNIKNKIGADAREIAEVIEESDAKYLFAHDYTTKEDTDVIYQNTNLENIILINPVEHLNGDLTTLRPNIKSYIENKYQGIKTDDTRNINWHSFIDLGLTYEGNLYTPSEEDTKLFSAYTSGSTGDRKEVIHSSKTFLEMLNQMIFPMPKPETRETWLWPVYPPSLVAVIVAYMCMPLAQGRYVVLDPYFDYLDTDLEIMHYEPNSTGLVPVFLEALIESNRIPENYDMSYLKVLGFGAEALPRKFVSRIESFLASHNCHAPLNGGYGNSEGGSQITIAFNNDILKSGSSGFPLINSIISVFEPGTEHELGYGEVGELCKSGTGIMLGYATEEDTSKTVKTHIDGQKWLHTGDLGYITPEGFVFVFGREGIKVYHDKKVYPLVIENKVTDIEGVKTAIIVSGDSKQHPGYQATYLFVVPFENTKLEELLPRLEVELKTALLPEEQPEELHLIAEKPVSHFKVDRKILRKNFHITTNNK